LGFNAPMAKLWGQTLVRHVNLTADKRYTDHHQQTIALQTQYTKYKNIFHIK